LRRLDPQSPDLLLLPGPREVEREVQARLREGVPFAFCAVDVEGLRENVERRGFIWGHRVLSQTAELLRRMVRERGGEGAYLGHQRDDDFVLLVAPERAEAVARDIARAFARLLPVIQGEASAEPLRLKTTVVVDPGGRFDRYTTLQGKVDASRRRDTGDLVIVDSP
jgi:GGDEF domain-containing protein